MMAPTRAEDIDHALIQRRDTDLSINTMEIKMARESMGIPAIVSKDADMWTQGKVVQLNLSGSHAQ